MIDFPCQGCGKKLSVPPDMAGKKGRCKSCDHLNAIPEPVASGPMPGRRTSPSPVAAPAIARPADDPVLSPVQRVHLVDADMPFGSMCLFILKWTFAAFPTLIVLSLILWLGREALHYLTLMRF